LIEIDLGNRRRIRADAYVGLDALARALDVLERRQRTGVIRSRAVLGGLHHHYGQI
jgi:hypothetical protein